VDQSLSTNDLAWTQNLSFTETSMRRMSGG